MLNNLSKRIYEAHKAKGFWDEDPLSRNVGECIALMHSELSEGLEHYREHGKVIDLHNDLEVCNFVEFLEDGGEPVPEEYSSFKDEFETRIKNTLQDELADTIIRVLDFCGAHKIDIDSHIQLKLAYNKLRPHKHGKKL